MARRMKAVLRGKKDYGRRTMQKNRVCPGPQAWLTVPEQRISVTIKMIVFRETSPADQGFEWGKNSLVSGSCIVTVVL